MYYHSSSLEEPKNKNKSVIIVTTESWCDAVPFTMNHDRNEARSTKPSPSSPQIPNPKLHKPSEQ